MRRFFHALFGLALFALIFGGAGVVARAGLPGIGDWERLSRFVAGERWLVLGAVGVVFFVYVLYLLTGIRPKVRGEQFLTFANDGGAVSISLRAVREFLARLGEEYAAIVHLQPQVRARGDAIDVEFDVRVRAGTQIPELCQMLQERVRQSLRENLGLAEVRNIRVNVREIVGETPPAPRPELPADMRAAL